VNALFVSGTQVTSQQFIEKVRAEMPNVMLVTDNDATVTLGYGQQEKQIGRNPNPYEGIITAGGPPRRNTTPAPTGSSAPRSTSRRRARSHPMPRPSSPGPTQDSRHLRQHQRRLSAPDPVPGDRGPVGKNLNVANWVHAVNTYGAIRDYGGGQIRLAAHGQIRRRRHLPPGEVQFVARPEGRLAAITPLEDIPTQ